MTEQAPAGWYPQPDGTQRYWDGSQWTEHIAPGAGASAEPAAEVTPAASAAPVATPESVVAAQGEPTAVNAAAVNAAAVNPTVGVAVADPTEVASSPWWKKPAVIITAAAVAVVLVIVIIVAAVNGGSKDPGPDSDTFVMPNLVGKDLGDAQDELESLGSEILVQGDATGQERTLDVELGWQVCTQDPDAGTEVTMDASVTLTAVLSTESCADALAGPEEEEPIDEPTDEPVDEPVVDGDLSNLTAAQQEGYDYALTYLEFISFSEKGLVDQLESDGLSTADAQVVVDALNLDWNAQAVQKVKDYLSITAMSESGLVGQLEYDGFTTEQAKAGVAGNTIDWNEQAAQRAQDYLDITDFTKDDLIAQLEYDGFTSAQAKHGAEAAGF